MKKILSLFGLVGLSLIAACATKPPPVKPAASNVEASRAEPAKNCKEIGNVEGRVTNINGKFEEALEDLKLDAARKGANFVQIQQTGSLGKSVAGTAYLCVD
jgi:hypothetical protein